jgi:hypothetical protein
VSPLRVEAALAGPVARSGRAPVAVSVTNVSDSPVLVNRRLAPGYRDSSSRELWADVRDEAGAPALLSTIDYERDLPTTGDYGELAPGESIAGAFDLFHYARPQRPGRYAVTVVYQADEPQAGPPPGIVAGEHAAEPVILDVG